jgi:hypothetical protein
MGFSYGPCGGLIERQRQFDTYAAKVGVRLRESCDREYNVNYSCTALAPSSPCNASECLHLLPRVKERRKLDTAEGQEMPSRGKKE